MSNNFVKRRFVNPNRFPENYKSANGKKLKSDRGRGTKRANSPDTHSGDKKRICTELNFCEKEPPKSHSPKQKCSKNLANNRLKNLRNSLQSEVETKSKTGDVKNSTPGNSHKTLCREPNSSPRVPSSTIVSSSNSYNTTPQISYNSDFTTRRKLLVGDQSPNIDTRKEKHKFYSPGKHSAKTPYNLASSRLQNIRNSLKKDNGRPDMVYGSPTDVHFLPKVQNESLQNLLQNEDDILVSDFDKYKSEQKKEAMLDLDIDGGSLTEPETMDWADINNKKEGSPEEFNYDFNHSNSPGPSSSKIKDTCVVTDTNIFLNSLAILREIYRMDKYTSQRTIVYIPYMVLTELDYLKDSKVESAVSRNAKAAIAYINKTIKDDSKQMKGQTIFEFEKQKVTSTNADDKILSCCLQAMEKYQTVVLLSNDINLKNKAMLHNIQTCSHAEILMTLQKLNNNVKRIHKVKHKMSILCSYIICECAKEAYGSVWNKMDTLKNPPWGLQDCLKIFKKLWVPVFQTKLMKHCIKIIDDFQIFLSKRKNALESLNAAEFNAFLEQCIEICVFLKDIPEYRSSVEKAIKEILEIRDS